MMKHLAAVLTVSLALAIPALTVLAQGNGEQGQVRKEMRAGNVRSLREIEERVLPRMPGNTITAGREPSPNGSPPRVPLAS